MNKNDLISSVAESSGLTKADAGRAVDGVFSSITSALSSGGDVRIVGFGTFKASINRAREIKTPRGDRIQVPQKRIVRFSPGMLLKKKVNVKKIE